MMAGTADQTQQTLYLFYSSRTEPQLLDRYTDVITYLDDAGINAEIVDVAEHPGRAKEFDVRATPTVIVREEGEEHRHVGVISGLKQVLQHDIYGQSLLHELGFREGRDAAKQLELVAADVELVEGELASFLNARGMQDVSLDEYDADEATAQVSMTLDPEQDDQQREHWHDKMSEFLGGFFTELFKEGVMATEIACAKTKDEQECVFTIGPNG